MREKLGLLGCLAALGVLLLLLAAIPGDNACCAPPTRPGPSGRDWPCAPGR